MDNIIILVGGIMVLTYIGVAVWKICACETISDSIGIAGIFLCGGLLVIPLAELLSTLLCWLAAIGIGIFIICAIFGN